MIEPSPADTNSVKPRPRKPAKKKRQKFEGVYKRCGQRQLNPHEPKDWDLCPCRWYYAFTFKKVRRRGPIPNVTNEVEAKTAYQLIKARIQNGQSAFEAPPPSGTTLKELGDDWTGRRLNRKSSTISNYKNKLRVHVYPAIGSIPWAALTHEDCDRFAKVMEKKELSPRTKQHVMVALVTLLNFGIKKYRLRTDNPALGLAAELRDPNELKHQVIDESKYFPADEAQHLLAVCRQHFPQWYAFVLTGLLTGMRLGELLGLKWSKINWRKSFIRVDEAWVQGDWEDAWTTTKNGRERSVDISKELRAVLRARRFARKNRTNELVFPSEAGTPIEKSNVRRRLWAPLLEKAELNHRTLHAMRHTFASLHLQRGASLAWVQKQLGHRSMDITLNTYGHFIPGGRSDEADKLADLVGGQDTRVLRRANNGNERPRSAANLKAVSQ